MSTFKLHDCSFNYTLIGDRQKPIILWLHGFMGNCHEFLAVINRLSEFCCLVVDLPGHGQTKVGQDADYQMPNTALGLIGLLETLAIEQCWLVGYSLGGRIALYLTVFFSQYFQGVILESASPGLDTQSERDRRIERDLKLAKQLESMDLAQFLQQWYANPLFRSLVQHPCYHQAIVIRLKNDPLKLAKSLRLIGLGMQPSLWSYLSEVQIPVLLIVGALDAKFREINQQMASLCPQASLNVVENSGHNVHFEQPAQFVNLINQILLYKRPVKDMQSGML